MKVGTWDSKFLFDVHEKIILNEFVKFFPNFRWTNFWTGPFWVHSTLSFYLELNKKCLLILYKYAGKILFGSKKSLKNITKCEIIYKLYQFRPKDKFINSIVFEEKSTNRF